MANSKAYNRRKGRSSKWIRRDVRFAIYLRDRFTCVYCGSDLSNVAPNGIGLDHLRARCAGGLHHPRNLVTACRRCNSSRQNRPWREFAGSVQGWNSVIYRRITNACRRKLNIELARAILKDRAPRLEPLT